MEDLGRAAAEVDGHAVHVRQLTARESEARNGDEEVEHAGRAVARAMDQHEAARSGTRERALGDPGDERRRDGCVDGVAPCFEDAGARLRGQTMAGGNCPSHAGRLARS